jgi:hypothetical protein
MEEIIDEVVETVVGRIALPGPGVGDWAERVRQCFISMHDEVLPYPGLAPRMALKVPPLGPAGTRNAAWLDDLLSSAGLNETDAVNVKYAVAVYIYGHLLATEVARGTTGGALDGEATRDRFLWGFDHLLDSFRQRFKTTRRPNSRRYGRSAARPSSRSDTTVHRQA